MLTEQRDRIRLIEQLMNELANVGKGAADSGYGRTMRIISNILSAIVDNAPLNVGVNWGDHIPPHLQYSFPYDTVSELRQAKITRDDLAEVKKRRDVNADLLIDIVGKLLDAGYRYFVTGHKNTLDYSHLERYIMSIASGEPTTLLSAEDVEKLKNADLITLDFSGFLTKSRIEMLAVMFKETNLTAQEIYSMSFQSDQTLDVFKGKVLFHKLIIEKDFDTTRYMNINASETISDLISISKGLPAKYTHFQKPLSLRLLGLDRILLGYLAFKMNDTLSRRYKLPGFISSTAPAPFVTPIPVPPRPKTKEEIEEEKIIHESAYQNLIIHFNLTQEDARSLVERSKHSDLSSLWYIKISVMPKVEKVLDEMMEEFGGNIQMVEDLVTFEQLIWSNETESWEKYGIPAQRFLHGKRITSDVSSEQSDILISLNKDLTLDLIKPLRENLTRRYQARHPGKEIVVGRDIKKFKEYTHIGGRERVPEFMYNNSNIIALINSIEPGPAPTEINLPEATSNYNQRGFVANNANKLMFDLMIIVLALSYLAYVYRRPLRYLINKTFFGKNASKNKSTSQTTEYSSVPTADGDEKDHHIIEFKR